MKSDFIKAKLKEISDSIASRELTKALSEIGQLNRSINKIGEIEEKNEQLTKNIEFLMEKNKAIKKSRCFLCKLLKR